MTIQEMADKIDIIIPVYNAFTKVKRTIYSYGINTKYHFILVVDGDNIDYEPLKDFFKDIQDIDIYYLPENAGPGIARNYGIDKATREYITFIDAGDTIYNTAVLENVIKMIIESPNYLMVSCAHYEKRDDKLETVAPQHNRMHGKFFKREFVNDYNIRFNPECSKMNEDIGFNFIARAIASHLADIANTQCILHLTDGLIVWESDEDSITRQNNYAFYYQKNNEGLSKNAIYSMNHLKQYQIPETYALDIMYQSLPSLYIFYYSCVFMRPEFEAEMYAGAKLFFNYLRDNDIKIDIQALTRYYAQQMRGVYCSDWDPFTMGIPDMTIIQWINTFFMEDNNTEN